MALVPPTSVPQPAHARTTKRPAKTKHQPPPTRPSSPPEPQCSIPKPSQQAWQTHERADTTRAWRCGISPTIRSLADQPTHRLLRPTTTPPTHRTPRLLATDQLRLHNHKPQPQTRHPNRRRQRHHHRPQHTLKATRRRSSGKSTQGARAPEPPERLAHQRYRSAPSPTQKHDVYPAFRRQQQAAAHTPHSSTTPHQAPSPHQRTAAPN